MRKNKSLIREYWDLKRRLRLITLSILVVVSTSCFLLSNSNMNFNLHFAWGLLPYIFSFVATNLILNRAYDETQAQQLNRFTLKFFTAKRLARPLLMNISFIVVLLALFALFELHSGMEKADIFFDAIPFMMVVSLGAAMRPGIRSTEDEEWEQANDFNPSLHSDSFDFSGDCGMSDMHGITSLLNPANPASALNISNPLHPSNM